MNVDCVICINKIDLDRKKAEEYKEAYEKAGFKVILTSSLENMGTAFPFWQGRLVGGLPTLPAATPARSSAPPAARRPSPR